MVVALPRCGAQTPRAAVVASWTLTPGVLNPDVTQSTIAATICKRGWTRTIRPPVSYTNDLKRKGLRQYGLRGPPSAFQEDHLISLELGGHPSDPRNLWPEPYPRAAAVDRIENELNDAVCSGRLTLAEAQRRESRTQARVGLTVACAANFLARSQAVLILLALMFYVTYVRNELVRRRARTIVTLLGLGVGVALVIAIASLSDGLDRAQKQTLDPLAGIGTDITVTLTPQQDQSTGFGGPGGGRGGNRDLVQANQSVITDLSQLGKPGEHFVHDFFLPGSQLTFKQSAASRSRRSTVSRRSRRA